MSRRSTYSQVVCHQAVEQMHIVLAQGAKIEELVDGGALQTQLSQTSSLLCFVVLGARRSETVGAQVLANI